MADDKPSRTSDKGSVEKKGYEHIKPPVRPTKKPVESGYEPIKPPPPPPPTETTDGAGGEEK